MDAGILAKMTKLLSFAFLAALCLTAWVGPVKAQKTADSWGICAAETARAEALLKIPAHLLRAIARVESGRWHKTAGENLAWPWTVMAEGRGRFLPSKAAAIAEVKALKARGVTNIDVGCMQVNLGYHPDAFEDLEQAFDPTYNVAYAASFLVELRAEARSWTRAVGRYHSRKAVAGNDYRRKVQKAWREERRKAHRRAQSARKLAAEG